MWPPLLQSCSNTDDIADMPVQNKPFQVHYDIFVNVFFFSRQNRYLILGALLTQYSKSNCVYKKKLKKIQEVYFWNQIL
jgi:hypothetical protein